MHVAAAKQHRNSLNQFNNSKSEEIDQNRTNRIRRAIEPMAQRNLKIIYEYEGDCQKEVPVLEF